MYGYALDMSAAARSAHAAMTLKDLHGVNFVVATIPYQQEGAVVACLTDQAAFAFASRHIYGLKGPEASQQLKWQLTSLQAVR